MKQHARHGLALGLALAALLPIPASAEELQHVVRPGESASAIAKRYYGGFEQTDLLLRFNGIRGSVIRPGETLRVPHCVVHTVRAGESWSGIAQRYLGRAADYEVMARLNRLDPHAALRVGQQVVAPVILEHRLERGETLERLALLFYGDPELAGLLAVFNRIDDPRRLGVGREIRVPLVSLLLAEPAVIAQEGPAAEAEAPPAAQPAEIPEEEPAATTVEGRGVDPEAQFTTQPAAETDESEVARRREELAGGLREARQAFAEGEYALALERLQSLASPIDRDGGPTQRAELRTLLAYVHVAFDRPEEACRVFLSADGGRPPAELDPDLVSPKIRAALARCDRKQEGDGG